MNLARQLAAEFLGTAALLIAVVGSGIMGETLSNGNIGLALLANSLATGACLYVLIQCFGPISGAHLNPAVSFVEWLRGKLGARVALQFASAQILGALIGVLIAHIMFGLDIFQWSIQERSGVRLLFSESVATFGLILVIGLSGHRNLDVTAATVSLYIMSAYWFTSSTSFANPAVTMARTVTNTFSGIRTVDGPGFILGQFLGALFAFFVFRFFQKDTSAEIDD